MAESRVFRGRWHEKALVGDAFGLDSGRMPLVGDMAEESRVFKCARQEI